MSKLDYTPNPAASIPFDIGVFQFLIENAFDMLAVTDADLRTHYVSPSVSRSLGYRAPDRVGHPVLDIAHPADKDTALSIVENVSRFGGTSQCFSLRMRGADLEYRTFDVVVQNRLKDPTVAGLVFNFRQHEPTHRTDGEAERSRKDIALGEVLEHLEEEKAAYRKELSANVENLLRPIVRKLRETGGRLSGRDIDVLEHGLDAIAGRNLDVYENNRAKLTPRELDVCELIRDGLSSKEIADRLGLSSQTVHKHRQSIRRKLQLDNRGINLEAFLRSRG